MTNENTQLININNYIPKQSMIFSKPISGQIPNSKPKIEFKRIKIFTKNEDGTQGELIIPTGRLYSFGVSENLSQETKKITGHTFPLCLWSGDKPTPEEKKWIDTFDEIVNCCIDHLLDNKEKIDKFDLERKDLTKTKGGLNPLYWKMEKITDENGKSSMRRVPDRGPTLYAKLICYKDKFLTKFHNMKDDKEIEPKDLMNKGCHAECGIKIESIFIGSSISLQVKLYEANVEPKIEMKRLIPSKCKTEVIISNSESAANFMENDEDSDTGSLM